MAGVATAAAISPWLIGGIAALGVGSSMYGASKNSKAQSSAMDQQKQMQMADLAFRQQQYNRYLGLYGPTEQNLANEANSSQPLDYDKMAAQIKTNYGDALRNETSAMGMRGIAGSGLDVGAMRGAALGQASGLTNAYSQGLINRRNLGLSLTGRGQIGQAAQGLQGGYQNMSGLYGNWANMYGNAAQQGWQSAGQGLGQLAYGLYGMNQGGQQPPSTTTNAYLTADPVSSLPPGSDTSGIPLAPSPY